MEHIYIITTKRNPKGKCIYFIRQTHTHTHKHRTRQVIKETDSLSCIECHKSTKERAQNGEEDLVLSTYLQLRFNLLQNKNLAQQDD